MSEEAEREYKRAKMRGMLSSFGAATALSLAFGLTLTFTVIYFATEQPAEFLAYVPPAENAAPRPVPTTPQLQSKAATPSNTVAPSVIVSTGAAPVAMAQIDFEMDDSADDGLSIDIGMGMDTGLGELGEGGSGMGSSQSSGSALEGTFYDLKQTRSKAPSKVAPKGSVDKNEMYSIVSTFLRSWDTKLLSRFYSPKSKLYASNFVVPVAKNTLAPEAFGCAKEVKPSGWMVVYRGKVKSPVDATIRFVGIGDDFIAVRFNGKMALETGYAWPSLFSKGDEGSAAWWPDGKQRPAFRANIKAGKDPRHKGYDFIPSPSDIPTWSKESEIGGFTAGSVIKVKEGATYPIDIAIAESGGSFGYILLWENLSDNPVVKNSKLSAGKKFYLFRTNFSAPTKQEIRTLIGKHMSTNDLEWASFDPDSPIWVAVP
ncbi:MAG: hypothetical protein J6R92_05350 [Akkermansia sp.]|nr:hypothetical protein [Akkermansia sp.]